MKIVTIIGARPQFIKAAVVSRAIIKHNRSVSNNAGRIIEKIVHTGQHYDRNMSDVFFEEMNIPKPDCFLDINGLSHGAMTGQMLEKIEETIIQEKPDVTLVYGDTNTTLAGALAAVKLHIPVAHVEAGLRSFNRHMPEEINRVLTDHVANILFCPTKQAVKNLEVEGIRESLSLVPQCVEASSEFEKSISGYKLESLSPKPPINLTTLIKEMPQTVALVGDVMLDAALYYKEQARKPQFAIKGPFILATIHRAENTDNPMRLKSIFNGFEKVSKEIPIILPLHPRTKKALETFDCNISSPNLVIAEPVGYLEIIHLLDNCLLVMTDSGGLQKEAFFFRKPCITLRNETEWVELVENGLNHLVGAETEYIYDMYKKVMKTKPDFNVELYGDGSAGDRIVNFLNSW